jgi:predicted nucleic acid-binding protein
MTILYNPLVGNGQPLNNVLLEDGAAALTTARRIQARNSRVEFHNGTSSVFLATLDDVTGASAFRGGFDATSGALPTAATVGLRPNEPLVVGNYVRVTAGGTITGISGDDRLEASDLLYLLDTNVLSALRRPDRAPQIADWLRAKSEDKLFISVVTLGEIERGIALQEDRNPDFANDLRGWIDRTSLLFADRLLAFGPEEARIWGRLSARIA